MREIVTQVGGGVENEAAVEILGLEMPWCQGGLLHKLRSWSLRHGCDMNSGGRSESQLGCAEEVYTRIVGRCWPAW
jgi:hypothetical protein